MTVESQTYSIANHKVEVLLENAPVPVAEALPSFQPFVDAAPSASAPVLSATVNSAYRPDTASCREVQNFEANGSSYRMFERPDKGIIITIRDYDRRPMAILDLEPGFHKASVAVAPDGRYPSALASALMIAYSFATSATDTVAIHSSTVVFNGKAYMFLGKSGTGKSTHSQSWLRNIPGCELLNDDNPIIRITNGQPIVYGSPWSGKTPCYKQKNAPVGALVMLSQARHNRIELLDKPRSFAALFESVSTLICHKSAYDTILGTMIRLAESARIYHLENLPDNEAAILCNKTIACP